MNKKLFFGQYKRIASYFEGTDLAATGLPKGRELELLESVRDKVPPELFSKPYTNPVRGGQTEMRVNMREAIALFREAGYDVRDQQMVNVKTGEPFSVEMLANTPLFERVFLFYKPSLERLGITVSVRTVDEAQYEKPAARLGLRYDHVFLAGIAVAGQRTARLLGLAAADVAGFGKHHRHQEPGGRRDDRQGHRGQDSRRADSRDQRARSYPAVESLRRAAVGLQQIAHGALGPLRPPEEAMPKYGIAAFPTLWWWDAESREEWVSRQ